MPKASKEKMIEAEKLFNDGMAMVEIAIKLGVSDGTVRSWKNRYGWGAIVTSLCSLLYLLIAFSNLLSRIEKSCICSMSCSSVSFGIVATSSCSSSSRVYEDKRSFKNEEEEIEYNRRQKLKVEKEEILPGKSYSIQTHTTLV